MPLTLIAMGWLFLVAGGRWRRRLVWAGCFVSILASYPVAWHSMRAYPYQFLEQAFTRSLAQDRTQEGTRSIGCLLGRNSFGICAHYNVEYEPAMRMGRYVVSLHLEKDAILTDDAQTFWAMLACGCPQLFLDRIDFGDAHWLDLVASPIGRVRYMLVTSNYDDKISVRYPGIATGKIPWAHLIHQEGHFYLLRLDRRSAAKS
jgi:hypothetical protein